MTDAGLPQQLLRRLHAEVQAGAGLLADTPPTWRSPAQRACSARVRELRAELDALTDDLERALHAAAALAAVP